ncbi:hypothetical protein SGLAD_v1c02330 [Spiroplasma gladiatoris]|uniref:Uncharacterized protein n=1 Tax=Spiroplasma gladiatoris TaxID=2143 RepID=A0A4P7AGZ4_9MOLU|nr:hypothetical protein [Spiroplasma gladiatoris]QBQ07432.1 hypothetical protein SGLAD_v1c02330 [Spiroplasma gladiatoris]
MKGWLNEKILYLLSISYFSITPMNYIISCGQKQLITEEEIFNMIEKKASNKYYYYSNVSEFKEVLKEEFKNYKYIYFDELNSYADKGWLIKLREEDKTKQNIKVNVEITSVIEQNNSYQPDYSKSNSKIINILRSSVNEMSFKDGNYYETNYENKKITLQIENFNLLENIKYQISDNSDQISKFEYDKLDKSKINIEVKLNKSEADKKIIIIFSADNAINDTKVIINNKTSYNASNEMVSSINSWVYSSWGEKTKIIMNSNNYKNVKVKPVNKNLTLVQDFKATGNELSGYVMFNEMEFNTINKLTEIKLEVSEETDTFLSIVTIELSPIIPINWKPQSYINLEVNEEQKFLVQDDNKNVKILISSEERKENNIIFKNGKSTKNYIDYSNEKSIDIEAWMYNKNNNKSSITIEADHLFKLDNSKEFSIKYKTDYNIEVLRYYYKNPNWEVTPNIFNIKPQNDKTLSWKISDKKIIVDTNAESFYFLIKTDIFRRTNCEITYISAVNSLISKINYTKPDTINDFTSVEIKYDLDDLIKEKQILIFWTINGFADDIEMIINYV